MSFDIVKAGWLSRESSILKRWKRNWFVLYQDGTLRYFESEDSHSAEEAVRMQPECVQIKAGPDVQDVAPPAGRSAACLLTLVLRDKTWNLCAESADDVMVWKLCLDEARVIYPRPQQSRSAPPPYTAVQVPPGQVPPPHGAYAGQVPPPHGAYAGQVPPQGAYPVQGATYAYPGQVVYGSDGPMYVVPANGQTTVVYTDDPYYYRRRHRRCSGDDMAMGLMAGAAVGSMMWWPLLWW